MKKIKKTPVDEIFDRWAKQLSDEIDKSVMDSITTKSTNAILVEDSDSQTLTMEKLIKVCDDIRKQYPDEWKRYELRKKLQPWEFNLLYGGNWNIK